ncbi:MAG: hypothetical protein MJY99_11965 [Fibrobacter sp.]|nr:hypothetical protein [Fibrobacter sp.]
MNGKPPLVKIAQKVILVLFGFAFCLAVFYGYHWRQAESFDNQEIGDGYFDYDAQFALDVFAHSLKKYEDVSCAPMPDYLYHTFDGSLDENLQETYSSAKVLSGYDQLHAHETKYEKYPLKVRIADKEKVGTVTASYRKENGTWFNDARTIVFDDDDSTTVLQIDETFKNKSRIYKGKRRNGALAECVDCFLKGNSCGDTISVERVDVDSVSGKKNRHYSKTLEYYFEGELTLKDGPFEDAYVLNDEYDYDELNRLVEYRQNNKVFRFVHSTRDTADLNVVLYGNSSIRLGFYKRSRSESKEVVRYGTRRFEVKETRYFKDGKLVMSEKEENEFYDRYSYNMEKYDASGNVVKDSSFSEATLLPGFRDDASSTVEISLYKSGKLKFRESRFYDYRRLLPFVLFPLKLDGNPVVGESYEYLYDSKGRLHSVVHHRKRPPFAMQTIFSYDLVGEIPMRDYTTCWVSPHELKSLEWKEVSDLRSESNDGRFCKDLACSVAEGVLTCENAVLKKFFNDYADSNARIETWDKCLYKEADAYGIVRPRKRAEGKKAEGKETVNDTLLSVPLSKDSLVYLNEKMLESKISLEAILCEGCEIRSVQDSIKDENGKLFAIEHFHESFTCKIGKELYEFSNWIHDYVLDNVAVSYGDTTGVPDCLVGFRPTNGISLGMTADEVDSLGSSFKKNKNEWECYIEYPLGDGFVDSRTILLNFRNGKVSKYRFVRNVMN